MMYRYTIMLSMLISYGMINSQTICLNKLFHHAGNTTASPSIELGSIVFYFDHYPKVVKNVVKQHGKTEHSFFLPDVHIKEKEVLEAMDRINKQSIQKVAGEPSSGASTPSLLCEKMPCAISIVQTSAPQKGLKITLVYNDRLVGIAYSRFDSISLQKGIVVRVYNNELLGKIKDTNKPIIQVACNTPPKIIIDCGHGGIDKGAVGHNNIIEKNINLQVGLQVAQLLKKKNIEVCLTRDSDTTMLLDERTTFANKQKADLFVSIHANADPKKNSSGIETYCLAHHLFKEDEHEAIPSVLNKQLRDKYAKSEKLAQSVHKAMLGEISSHHPVKDRRIKYDVAQVLLGTNMPAILVEIGYVTHEQESQLLAQAAYQSFIAHGIVQGIDAYLNLHRLTI